jgi:4-diphosphocytidyl-2-C-methyl-D-erythritol kinase
LTPPLSVSTASVYREWDAMGGPVADGPNDLEPAALRVCPELRDWRDLLANQTGCVPSLAGSGSTWFVAGTFPEVAGATVARTVAY